MASDNELREYIESILGRLERVATRLETYAEENDEEDGRSTSADSEAPQRGWEISKSEESGG